MTTKPLLQLHDLSAGYFQRGKAVHTVVESFSASIEPGSLICLIGPNGAGKSTLLRTITGMQKPLSGKAMLRGHDIHQMSAAERAKRLSIVLTQKIEVGLLTGYELVAMGRHPHTGWLGQLSEHDHRLVQVAIARVGAERLADRIFSTLSDGERQKIMIARALAQEPELLVLDEPTAFLDLPRRVEIMMLLRDLARQTGCAILLSTHDLDLALRCAHHIWLLTYSGDIQTGVPEDLVLSGAFEAAFQSAGVTFDIMSGGFHPVDTRLGHVVLIGDGVHYVWTKRALERAGFAVAATPQAGLPVIRIDIRQSQWQLTNQGESATCHSIGDAVTTLASMLA